jgi:hypothetical protein
MTVLTPAPYLQNLTGYTAQLDRLAAIASGVAADASGLTFMDGVRGFGDLLVTAQGTPNMTVQVAAGMAIVEGTENAAQGPYVVINDAPLNLTIGAANASFTRFDLIVARIRDQVYSGTQNTATIEVIAGTASATPADPTVPANCLVLARVTVVANDTAINTGDITDLRKFTAAPGGKVLVLNQAWNANTSTWGGTTSSSGTTGITAGTGFSVSSQSWMMKNGMCTFTVTLTRTGADITTPASGNIADTIVATLPSGMRPAHVTPAVGGSAGTREGSYSVGTNGDITLVRFVPSQTLGNGDTISVAGVFVL